LNTRSSGRETIIRGEETMSETDKTKQTSTDAKSGSYVAPEIESVVTRQSLDREVAYAGGISQQQPPP
jgi:hypothetical protein